jgi:hypothetical protein
VKSLILFTLLPLAASFAQPLPRDEGYRGIWYYNQPSKDQYKYKYSGGFATYPQQHAPIAIYSKADDKTFFVYGGTVKGKQELLHMVSYYDHKTGMVPRPVILMNKRTDDAPYSIDDFERISETNFSYPQPWHIAGEGFLFLHTRYRDGGRSLFWMRSADGRQWTEPELLSRFELGHYQISLPTGKSVGTAFNYHPKPLGLNERTNIYYLATSDMGTTWKTAAGTPVKLPLQDARNPALVHDFKAEKLLVYMKDMQYDSAGRPVLLYLTSKDFESGPKNDPRLLHTARWDGKNWIMRSVTTTDHNYDYGSLYIESGGLWRIIATTAPGPQAYGTGGEVVIWQSRDQGKTWTSKQLTNGSTLNQNHPRRPLNAHPDFYALWADGNAFQPSESSLYFTDRNGSAVWKLPSVMKADSEKPQRVR